MKAAIKEALNKVEGGSVEEAIQSGMFAAKAAGMEGLDDVVDPNAPVPGTEGAEGAQEGAVEGAAAEPEKKSLAKKILGIVLFVPLLPLKILKKIKGGKDAPEGAEGEEGGKKGKKGKKAKKEKKPKKDKKKAKKPKKKKAPKKKKKGGDDEEDEGGGGKKKLIIIIVAVLALAGGGAFAAMKFGLLGGVLGGLLGGGGGADGGSGLNGTIPPEEDEDYIAPTLILTDGIAMSEGGYNADWYKLNFYHRFGLQNGDGKFVIVEFDDETLEAAESELLDEQKKANAQKLGLSTGSAEDESAEADEKAEDEDSEKEESDEEESEEKEEEAEEEEESEEDSALAALLEQAKQFLLADSCVKNWAYYTGNVNPYGTLGNEGYSYLVPEYTSKLLSSNLYNMQHERIQDAMLFSSQTDFNIRKTLLSSDYKYAYVEFERNLEVSRCLNPEHLYGTIYQGVAQGQNQQTFSMELLYDGTEKKYNIYRINLLENGSLAEPENTGSASAEEEKK